MNWKFFYNNDEKGKERKFSHKKLRNIGKSIIKEELKLYNVSIIPVLNLGPIRGQAKHIGIFDDSQETNSE